MKDRAIRSSIRSEASSIEPFDALELVHQDAVLAWIDSGAELHRYTKPDGPPQHLVAYAVIVDGDRILLVDHISAGLWLPPGGHVEKNEHPRDAAKRELLEETGIRATVEMGAPSFLTVTPTVGIAAGHVDVSLWYVLDHDSASLLSYDGSEFTTARWFAFDEVPLDRSDPHMHRFLRKIAATRRAASTPRRTAH